MRNDRVLLSKQSGGGFASQLAVERRFQRDRGVLRHARLKKHKKMGRKGVVEPLCSRWGTYAQSVSCAPQNPSASYIGKQKPWGSYFGDSSPVDSTVSLFNIVITWRSNCLFLMWSSPSTGHFGSKKSTFWGANRLAPLDVNPTVGGSAQRHFPSFPLLTWKCEFHK